MIKWIKNNYLFFLFILCGVILRFIWASDMEWKVDEKWMFEKAQEIAKSSSWLPVGMQSGGGIVNPGMSLWVFVVFSFFTSDPVVMVRFIMALNVLAIIGFLIFIYKRVDASQKIIWLWGIALASVNPLEVLFARKIWAQDVLPLFTFIVILANSHRDKKLGAFFWGMIGALLGQIHMSGFFFAFGLFLFSLIYDLYNKRKFRWQYWLVGSIIGGIGLIPWIAQLVEGEGSTPARLAIKHIFQFNFYLYWFIDSTGLNLMYSLREHFWDFMKLPRIAGIPLFIVSVAHLFLLVFAGFIVKRIVDYLIKAIKLFKSSRLKERLIMNLNITDFFLLSILLGLGIFMTLAGITIHPHYLIVAFPFPFIFLAKMVYPRKKLFIWVLISQLFLTITFLFYIHINEGAPEGDYGKTYKSQIETKKTND